MLGPRIRGCGRWQSLCLDQELEGVVGGSHYAWTKNSKQHTPKMLPKNNNSPTPHPHPLTKLMSQLKLTLVAS